MTTATFWDDVDQGTGHLKAGFLGFQKSGKTYTATLLALATREMLRTDGPIAFFDTETGSAYIKDLVAARTGRKLLVRRSRAFDDLLTWGERCVAEGVSVGIVDSITHPWQELCDSYLAEKNDRRKQRKQAPQQKLEMDDWNVIKPLWGQWSDFYVNSPLSIIICGRAGWEYEMALNEDTGRKELERVGVKMKTEGEFGFEPSLLVQMDAEQTLHPGTSTPSITRRATVLGDRFALLDGKSTDFVSCGDDHEAAYRAVKAFFLPVLSRLRPGEHAPVDTQSRTVFGLDESGDAEWARERRQRIILSEEIQAELITAYPGQTASEKSAKVALLKRLFGTGSWTRIAEGTRSDDLRKGLERLRKMLALRTESPSDQGAPAPGTDAQTKEAPTT